jgi:hypothetical protein
MSKTIGRRQPKSAAYFFRQIRLFEIRVTELERRLKREQGPVAFAAYQEAVTAIVQQDADTGNVVRLRRRGW